MSIPLMIEIVAVAAGLAYVVFLMKENIWCWLFGIVSSALSIWLFFSAKLYAELVLYVYYVAMGFYGWYHWSQYEKEDNSLAISELSIKSTVLTILIGIVGSLSLSFLFQKFTDAARPLIDSFTTIFAFLATYLQTQKVLSNWLYWIGINGLSIWLYYDRGLFVYAGLMFVYFVLSILGFKDWYKKFKGVSN